MIDEGIIEEIRVLRDEANAVANHLVDLLGRLEDTTVEEVVEKFVYRVELNHPIRLDQMSRKTRIFYVETASEEAATADFRTRNMARKGIMVVEVRLATAEELETDPQLEVTV